MQSHSGGGNHTFADEQAFGTSPLADTANSAHTPGMKQLTSGKLWLLAVLGAAALTIILSHELIAGPMQIDEAVSKGVAGFACRDLVVEPPGGSWNRNNHIMRAALRMPQPCLADLRRRVVSSPQYHAEQCNLVEQCWVRGDGEVTYTFRFYPDYASFHYEKRQPAGE